MASRLSLQSTLESKLGSRNVYFQPPESVKMSYPTIRYSLSTIDTVFADDNPWRHERCYDLVLIDSNPDSQIVNKLLALPKCKFGTAYRADNLNHFTFN